MFYSQARLNTAIGTWLLRPSAPRIVREAGITPGPELTPEQFSAWLVRDLWKASGEPIPNVCLPALRMVVPSVTATQIEEMRRYLRGRR